MKRMASLASWLFLAAAMAFLAYVPTRSQSAPLLAGFAVAFAAYLLAARRAPDTAKGLITLAMGLRVLLFFAPVSWTDDHFRYLWDGMCSVEGISPFGSTPEELLTDDPEAFTPEAYAQLNSPHFYSVYPPVAQTAFWAAAAVGQGNILHATWAMRAIVLLAELLTLLALAVLLKGPKNAAWLLALYALNPLVLMEFTVNLHTEALALPACLWALVLLRRERSFGAAALLAIAASVKLWPILFLAWLPVKYGLKKSIAPIAFAASVFTVAWVPFWTPDLVPHFLSSVKLYGNYLELNGLLFESLRRVLGDTAVKGTGLLPAFMLLSIGALTAWSWWKKQISFAGFMLWVSAIFLFCGQVVHPWYILPLVAFGIASNWYWPVAWSLLIMPTYLTYGQVPFAQPYWWIPVEYGLLAAFMAWEWRFAPWRKSRSPEVPDSAIPQR
ncbi:MAG: glycosyltransferase 87 family protein [Flavobacteriales bacterium]|jgi:hypothetical protein|nr:glycosyltransferase 87 family protein [Flavobacteriales bacterium]